MTNSASAIAVAPIVEALRPIISAVVTTIVGVAVTFGVALLKRWAGVTLQSAYVDFASSSSADRSWSSRSRGC